MINFMVDHLKLKCLLKTLDCCVQVQSYCESSKFQLIFVCICSELLGDTCGGEMITKFKIYMSANKVGVLMNCNCY